MSPLVVVILAAGQGKRMKSSRPKVLHRLAGRTLLEHVVAAARTISPAKIIVVHGHGGDRVRSALSHLEVEWVEQSPQLGTGHAVSQAVPRVADESVVLVLYGDVPLVNPVTLEEVVARASEKTIGLLTVELSDPTGYGRILRHQGRVTRIVEDGDATPAEREVGEVNTGILAVPAARLRGWLAMLEADNAQGEYYLTDVTGLAVRDGMTIETAAPLATEEVLGINDRVQLAELERYFQRREARRLMYEGVSLADPARLDVRGEVVAGRDVSIDVNVILEGRVVLGDEVVIGPNAVIRDAEIGPHTEILANCVIDSAVIGAECRIGPYARIRPETELATGVHVGNFVEIKKSRLGDGSKVNHLSYVGDSEVGRRANVGAGTITCNYDGANKHRTVIGDDAFIGSGSQLVAPVHVAAGSTIGAGSTITKDTPAGELTLSRARQTTIRGWRRPVKK